MNKKTITKTFYYSLAVLTALLIWPIYKLVGFHINLAHGQIWALENLEDWLMYLVGREDFSWSRLSEQVQYRK